MLATGLLLLLLLGGERLYAHSAPMTSRLRLSVTVEGTEKSLSLWEDGSGTVYAFLPGHAAASDIRLYPEEGLSLNGSPLTEGQPLPEAALAAPCTLEKQGFLFHREAPLVFLQSRNVATLYVSTANGSMLAVNDDKTHQHREPVQMTLVRADGAVDYQSTGADTIKGRGNSTWEAEKKPYALRLSAPASLLGMDASTDWILLADAYDDTSLRNKLCLDLIRRAGADYAIDSDYADVYLNGEYAGLYLLTENPKTEPASIAEEGELYLLELMEEHRVDPKKTNLKTAGKRRFAVDAPERLTAEETEMLGRALQELEDAVNGGAEDIFALVDTSFVTRILLDEVLIRLDADSHSTFFTYSAASGKFGGGPLWDFDLSLGNTWVESRYRHPTQLWGKRRPWYGGLYGILAFREEMARQYADTVRPLLADMRQNALPALLDRLEKARAMNLTRWDTMFREYEFYVDDPQERVDMLDYFLEKRLEFLDAVFVKKLDVCQIDIRDTTGFLQAMTYLPTGEALSEEALLTALREQGIAEERVLDLRYEESGEEIDLSQPVREDTRLTVTLTKAPREKGPTGLERRLQQLKELVLYRAYALVLALSLLAFAVLTLYLLLRLLRERKRGKGHGA